MNPSSRNGGYIVLYNLDYEEQHGSFYKIHCFVKVKRKEDVLPTILTLSKERGARGFEVFILGKKLEVEWE